MKKDANTALTCNFKFAMSNPKVHLLEDNSLGKLIVSFR